MSAAEPKYNIKAVSQMLAIQPGTLRAWERRYKIIRPARNEAGHRLYTDDHIRTLEWLVKKVDQGFTISQAVSLLGNDETATGEVSTPVANSELNLLREQLLRSLLSYNENEAQNKLDQAFSLFIFETVATEIIGPILVKVGELWKEGQITSAHEHFASNFFKSKLEMMYLSISSHPRRPEALLVCAPNEQHELGLLIFSIYLKRQGYKVVNLGQGIVSDDIESVIDELKPTYLFISCTMETNVSAAIQAIESLNFKLPDLTIGVGGLAYDRLLGNDLKRVAPFFIGNNKQDWDAWLHNN